MVHVHWIISGTALRLVANAKISPRRNPQETDSLEDPEVRLALSEKLNARISTNSAEIGLR